MHLLIFDMDGVLLKPIGYHRALKETVRQAGISLDFGDALLTGDHIARFEALGISSEWHSSALSMAFLTLQVQRQNEIKHVLNGGLDLESLFEELGSLPMSAPPLQRGLAAIKTLAVKTNSDPEQACEIVVQAENIHLSPTLKWFQEMVLGSAHYAQVYNKKPIFDTSSYLKKYDQPMLSKENTKNLLKWTANPLNGAVIMTSRPSLGPTNFMDGALDAKLGAKLVGLGDIPLIGFGDISWLAAQSGQTAGVLAKPAWQHGMAAILAASGWPLEKSLLSVRGKASALHAADLTHLRGSNITVFEDTTSGLFAVQKVADLLNKFDIPVSLQKIGITDDPAKRAALLTQDASVYTDINQALEIMDLF
jgi:hypothetical protein